MRQAAVIVADFGTTRVKSALCRQDAGVVDVLEVASPSPRFGPSGEVEINPREYTNAFNSTVGTLLRRSDARVEAIWLCSEMHGFLLDDGNGNPLTPYFSWRDQRAAQLTHLGSATIDWIQRHTSFHSQSITGMALRPGLPCVTAAHLAREGGFPPGARFLSLPEWIAVTTGQFHGSVHESIAAASGFYDINAERWSDQILDEIGLSGCRPRFSHVLHSEAEPIGTCMLDGRVFPLFGGVGDMQAAMLGAGVPAIAPLGINLGTGSQVARVVAREPGVGGERRPFFERSLLCAITHIPAGRALDVFSRFFDSVAEATVGYPDRFWRVLADLSPDEVLSAGLKVDIGVFSGAWRFGEGGAVSGILEGNFDARTFVASIANAWLQQYADALQLLDPDGSSRRVVLGGGLAHRLEAIPAILGALSRRDILAPRAEEETLAGLQQLAFAKNGWSLAN